jgi:hypothetical protein
VVVRLDADHRLGEIVDLAVVEIDDVFDANFLVGEVGGRLLAVFYTNVAAKVVAAFGRSVFFFLGGEAESDRLDLSIDVGVGDSVRRAVDGQFANVRKVERRANLGVELVNEVAFFRKDDRFRLKLRFGDEIEDFLFVDLLQTLGEDGALDAVGGFGAELPFDQFSRRLTRAKTWDGGLLDELADFLVEIALHVGGGNGDLHVLEAGAGVGHVDLLIELDGLFAFLRLVGRLIQNDFRGLFRHDRPAESEWEVKSG